MKTNLRHLRNYSLPLLTVILFVYVFAKAQSDPRVQPDYRLNLVTFYDANPLKFCFVVTPVTSALSQPVVATSVDGLKRFLATLPKNSMIEWAPGCCRIGGEPLLSSAKEMEDFKAFCHQQGLHLVIVPSG